MNDKLRRYLYSLMTDDVSASGAAAELLKCALYLLSLVYALLLDISVKCAPKPYRPRCKVISVGNITLGGTGKTPLVAEIARRLKRSGKRVVILTRGYKKDKMTGLADEAEMFKGSLDGVPVVIGRDRVRSAKEAESKYSPDALLLDDGFQHRRLARDLDIVSLDVNNPFGNGMLIPRGILREPVAALGRAQVAVITKVIPEMSSMGKAEVVRDRVRQVSPSAEIFNASYFPRRLYDISGGFETDTADINGKSVALLCAIADPRSFEDTVVSLGANAAATYYFMDHHDFSASEIGRAVEECGKRGIDAIITTEKDVPRIVKAGFPYQASGVKILALAIDIRIDREEDFFGRLDTLFTR